MKFWQFNLAMFIILTLLLDALTAAWLCLMAYLMKRVVLWGTI